MPAVNPTILIWARETAGLSLGRAAVLLGIKDARDVRAVDRLAALEAGEQEPSRSLLIKMAEKYRRPLLTFYLSAPPKRGDRGQDFRSLPERQTGAESLVDALLRDVRARQSSVRDFLAEDEDFPALPFIGSMRVSDGVEAVVRSISETLAINLSEYRGQPTTEKAFALLRARAEDAGIFVLLIGNLGSHHTAIDVEAFRGFALADPVAPFVVINDQDAAAAWSFTLIHELAHLWLGQTGVSGRSPDLQIEKFCNDVAGAFLLPASDLRTAGVTPRLSIEEAMDRISDFAASRHVSRSMVAYSLYRAGLLTEQVWLNVTGIFAAQWRRGRDAKRERQRDGKGPNYYVIRRHRLGPALLRVVARGLDGGNFTPTKASTILGVKARSVATLLSPPAANGRAA